MKEGMTKKDIKHKHAHIFKLENLFSLEEIDNIRLHPQKKHRWGR